MTNRKSSESEIAEAIGNCLISPNEADQNLEAANVVDGLFRIGRALDRIADALRALGNGNAATQMGAIEAMSVKIGESIEHGLSAVADALKERDLA